MTDRFAGHSRRNVFRLGAGALLAAAAPRLSFAQDKVKVGVIGSGKIGGTIGGLWVKSGHPVLFSSRNPENLKGLVEGLGPLAKAGTVEEALAFSDVIFLAVPYKAVPQLSKDYGPKFAGKILLDADNATVARDGEDLVKETKEKGIGNTTASYFPGAHVVRAFNSMGVGNFVRESNRAGERMAIPIAGDDPKAIAVATQLITDAGFDAVAVPLARAQEFAQGGPIYGQQLTAKEMRAKFGLTQ